MNEIGIAYRDVLSRRKRQALSDAVVILLDHYFDDLDDLQRGEAFDSTWMASALPRRYLPKYSPAFARRFLICMATVGWKLAQPKRYPLACVGEELAALEIIDEAKSCLEIAAGVGSDEDEEEDAPASFHSSSSFVDLEEVLFEDMDVLFLFDQRYDGIDTSPVGDVLQMMPMGFHDWFVGYETSWCGELHPYYAQGAYRGSTHPTQHPLSTVGQAYTRFLSETEQAALVAAIPLLMDETIDDILACEPDQHFVPTRLATYLPPPSCEGLTPVEAKAFLWCISTVAWKLAQPRRYRLSSIAEQLAAHAIVTRAKAWLSSMGASDQSGEHRDTRTRINDGPRDTFRSFEQAIFVDGNVEILFSGSAPKQPETHFYRYIAPEVLHWYQPFSPKQGIHYPAVFPYTPGW